jgi:hypothetical protein
MNFTQTFVFSHSTNLNTPWISRRPESIRSQFLVLAGINHGSIATGLYYIYPTYERSILCPLEEGDIDEATHPGVSKLYKMDISSKTLLICIAKRKSKRRDYYLNS